MMIVNRIVVVLALCMLQLAGGAAETIDESVDVTNEEHNSNYNIGIGSTLPSHREVTVVSSKNPAGVTKKQRQLQLFGGEIDRRCEQLMDNTLEGIFAPKDCNCNPVGFPPALVIDCEQIQESCIIPRRFTDALDDKLLCGSPGIRITVNIWSIILGGSPVVAELCFYDVSIFNVTVPDIINPVCFGIFAGLPGSVPLANLLGLVFGQTASTAKLLQETTLSKPASSVLKTDKRSMSITEKSCVPKLGDNNEKCNSCTICPPEDGGGVIFDCSNVIPNFRSTECTVFPTFA